VIGGRVLDVTAIVGFCTGASVYAEALVMTAIEENIVLTVPSAALARACALIPWGHELGVDVLLGLPCTVVDPLDTTQARAVGALVQQGGDPGRDLAVSHVVHCAQRRGWPVVTSDPAPLLSLDSSIEIESLS
jgi:acyl transferase domain-containing protein